MGAPGIKDARPPFAGLDGKAPEELFGALPTPCYILDEAALRKTARSWPAWRSAPDVRFCWPRRRFQILISTPCWSPIWQAQRPAASTRRDWARRRCRGRRFTCSAARTGRTSSTSCCAMRIISCSTPPASWNASAPRQRPPERAWGCASTRSARPRRDTPSTTLRAGSRMGTTRDQWLRK